MAADLFSLNSNFILPHFFYNPLISYRRFRWNSHIFRNHLAFTPIFDIAVRLILKMLIQKMVFKMKIPANFLFVSEYEIGRRYYLSADIQFEVVFRYSWQNHKGPIHKWRPISEFLDLLLPSSYVFYTHSMTCHFLLTLRLV